MKKQLLLNIAKLKDDTRRVGIALIVGAILAFFFEAASTADAVLVLGWGLILVVAGTVHFAEEEQ